MIMILFWIVYGCLIGWIAAIIGTEDKRRQPVSTICLGILGSTIGGVIGRMLESSGSASYVFGNISMVLAILGAVGVITAGNFLKKLTSKQ